MKKIGTIALAAVMCVFFSAVPLSAGEIPGDAPVVNVTISQKGKLELVQKPMTVTDVNENGIYDVDDVLTLAHEEYCAGGYSKTGNDDAAWITKLWGYDAVTTGCGYYLNDVLAGGIHSVVKNGDQLHAFIFRNWATETYSCFDKKTLYVRTGQSFTLNLVRDSGVMGSSVRISGFSPVSGATVTVNGKSGDYQTNASGNVTLSFDKVGVYVISAKMTNDATTIVAPVCVVNVVGPTDPENPVDPVDPVDPVEPVEPVDPIDPVEPVEPAIPIVFADVKASDWYYEAVQYVAQKGLMEGMENNEFSPATDTTRGQLVTILYRMEGEPGVEGLRNPFTDLTQSWYKDAVIWAAEHEIVKGITETTYVPEDAVTREQVATILYRYAVYKGYDVSGSASLNRFPDAAQTSDYAKTALSWAVSEGLVNGTVINGKTLLDPQGTTIRAQLAALLQRFCEDVVQ